MSNYIDNKKMLAAFIEHKNKVGLAKEQGKEEPRLPNYLGLCFMQIADGLGRRGNFSGYSYLDEMKADGIENAVIAANNFDPSKSSNPYGYFTKIIWFAYLRRIEKEKKQTYVKYKAMHNMNINGMLTDGTTEDFMGININVDNEFMDAIVTDFEDKKKKKDERYREIKESKKKVLDEFFSEDPEVDAIEIETHFNDADDQRS